MDSMLRRQPFALATARNLRTHRKPLMPRKKVQNDVKHKASQSYDLGTMPFDMQQAERHAQGCMVVVRFHFMILSEWDGMLAGCAKSTALAYNELQGKQTKLQKLSRRRHHLAATVL